MSGKYPYPHTYDDNGIQRQAMIHQSNTGDELVWDPRRPGDPEPWVNLEHDNVRATDDEVDDDFDPDEDRDGF
ncbi:hypothetical protein [Streptomyces sp. NBC_00620]|uniref:hypothetical protein n=1 Tax=Streptomyces sp. NBC_00620 TaxID=2903666 RepID=UPI00224D7EF6|nr:hypothetical protein [Streptomyces sp. NBC_00620]MCX4974247.1 hypothetical protein [Streptomyces sp. NBC_00620]